MLLLRDRMRPHWLLTYQKPVNLDKGLKGAADSKSSSKARMILFICTLADLLLSKVFYNYKCFQNDKLHVLPSSGNCIIVLYAFVEGVLVHRDRALG